MKMLRTTANLRARNLPLQTLQLREGARNRTVATSVHIVMSEGTENLCNATSRMTSICRLRARTGKASQHISPRLPPLSRSGTVLKRTGSNMIAGLHMCFTRRSRALHLQLQLEAGYARIRACKASLISSFVSCRCSVPHSTFLNTSFDCNCVAGGADWDSS